MSLEILSDVDFSAWEEPDPSSEPREFLESWLDFQRHEYVRKLRDLSQEQLVAWSIPPVELEDYAGASVSTVDEDLHLYFSEVDKANRSISAMPSLDSIGDGTGRTLQATLVKMVDEYALHAGQAHMLRFAALGEMIR